MNEEVHANQSRIIWVDYAKSVGIFLVVLGHCHIPELAINFIFSFHMPLFFVLSGYLDKSKGIIQTARMGVKSLLVPYAVLYLVTYPYWLFVVYPHAHSGSYGYSFLTILKSIGGLFAGTGHDTVYTICTNIPLWFLVALFFVKCTHSGLMSLARDRKPLLCALACIPLGAFLLLKVAGIGLCLSIDSAMMAYLFYLAGYLVRDIRLPSSKLAWAGLFVTGFLVTFVCFRMNGRVDVNGTVYGNSVFLFYICGISGSVMVVALSKLLKGICDRLAIVFAYGTVFILAFHPAILAVIKLILSRFMSYDLAQVSFVLFFIMSLLVMIISYFIIRIVSTRIPILTGRYKPLTGI